MYLCAFKCKHECKWACVYNGYFEWNNNSRKILKKLWYDNLVSAKRLKNTVIKCLSALGE